MGGQLFWFLTKKLDAAYGPNNTYLIWGAFVIVLLIVTCYVVYHNRKAIKEKN